MSNIDTLYVRLVCPHLEYVCSVWAPASHKDIDSLEELQKFAFRMAVQAYSQSFVPHTCSLWNSLPYEVVSLPSFVSFKRIQNYY